MPCPPSGDLPNPGIEPRSPALQANSLPTELSGKPCIPEVIDISPGNLDSSLCFIQLSVSHDVPHPTPVLLPGKSHGLYDRILQATILEWVAFPSSGDRPNPGIKSRSPALQVYSLPAEPQGKPKNTGVGRLCLLQGICPTQESNGGLLNCRQILYQLSYQGDPK